MEVREAIRKRRSVRSYKEKEVEQEKLGRVLESARLAPSAHNAQDWKFIVVKDKEKREALASCSGQSFISQAPIVIVALSLHPEGMMSSGIPSYAVNVAIAVDHMTLQATEEGLGTCWIGAFEQEEVKEILKIPRKYKVVVLLPLGYPKGEGKFKDRKELREIVSFDSF